MFQELELSGNNRAQDAVHCKVECGIVVLYNADFFFSADLGCKLLTDFADDAFFRRFARFNFAAGDFPPVFVFAVAALGGEEFVLVSLWICAEDDCAADGDLFHDLCP